MMIENPYMIINLRKSKNIERYNSIMDKLCANGPYYDWWKGISVFVDIKI